MIRYSVSFTKDIEELLGKAREMGLEGLIGKRSGSRYEAGKRTGAWVKIKLHLEQEFVIGGYTEPQGARKHFGALLVGFYEGKRLKFAGRVGTGFSEKLLRTLFSQLNGIRAAECPFFNLPAAGRSRWGQGLTAAEMRRCHWVKPTMVCQIKFTEWTRDDRLRQPIFLGIRVMARHGGGAWHGVQWDGKTATSFPLNETDEKKAMQTLLLKNPLGEAANASDREINATGKKL